MCIYEHICIFIYIYTYATIHFQNKRPISMMHMKFRAPATASDCLRAYGLKHRLRHQWLLSDAWDTWEMSVGRRTGLPATVARAIGKTMSRYVYMTEIRFHL